MSKGGLGELGLLREGESVEDLQNGFFRSTPVSYCRNSINAIAVPCWWIQFPVHCADW